MASMFSSVPKDLRKTLDAISWLHSHTKDFVVGFSYEPGDLVIINQRTTMRGIDIPEIYSEHTQKRWLVSTTAKIGPDSFSRC
jgi:alpha-ketoglutarate-dependent taurine dioxygenase